MLTPCVSRMDQRKAQQEREALQSGEDLSRGFSILGIAVDAPLELARASCSLMSLSKCTAPEPPVPGQSLCAAASSARFADALACLCQQK